MSQDFGKAALGGLLGEKDTRQDLEEIGESRPSRRVTQLDQTALKLFRGPPGPFQRQQHLTGEIRLARTFGHRVFEGLPSREEC